MFESDGDWDLDQDFLDDIDEKATQYYTQSESTVKDESGKKRKLDTDDCSTSKTTAKQDDSCSEDTSRKSRTDLVLGLFSKTYTKKTQATNDKNAPSQQLSNKDISKSVCFQAEDKQSDNVTRKNLVLEILKNKNASQKTDSSLRDNTKDSKIDGKSCNKVQPKVQDTRILQYKDKRISEKAAVFKESKTPSAKSSDNLKKQMVLDILKQYPPHKKSEKPNGKNSSVIIKIPHASEKVALVRKFPGPAGLLPDKIDGFIPPESYWNSIEETENKRPESNLSEFCSQHTKNLFTEGAWQHMLDDLPPDFLKDFDIASTKHKANTNHNRSTKVQFLAGIIDCIDHSHENPPIVLKDFTDSIQGIVHHDIPTKYPGLLEPNVVLLLHDVGLLRISGSLFSSKYNVLISPSSLLGIYSSKGDIVHTPRMKVKFGDDLSLNHEKLENSKPNLIKLLTNRNATDTKNTDGILSQETLELAHGSVYFDDSDDISFCVSPTDITNSQNQKNFINSTSATNSTLSGKKTIETALKNLKKLSSVAKADKQIPSTKEFGPDQSPKSTNKTLTEKLLSVSDFDLTKVDLNDSIKNIVDNPQSNIETKVKSDLAKGKSSARSKLFQFRSNDVLTPPESNNINTVNSIPETISNSQDNKNELPDTKPLRAGSKLFESMLYSSENNSDDEMLSQLDVDTIFSNYDKSK